MGCKSVFKRLVRSPRQHHLRHEALYDCLHLITIWQVSPLGHSKFEMPQDFHHDSTSSSPRLCYCTTSPTSTCCRVRFARTRMFPHGRPAHFLGPAPPRPPTGEQLSVEGLDSDSEQCSETVAQRISSAVLIACGRLS